MKDRKKKGRIFMYYKHLGIILTYYKENRYSKFRI